MPELIRPSYSPRKDQLFAQLLAQGQTMPQRQPMPQGMEPQPGQTSQLAQLMAAQPQPFRPRFTPDQPHLPPELVRPGDSEAKRQTARMTTAEVQRRARGI